MFDADANRSISFVSNYHVAHEVDSVDRFEDYVFNHAVELFLYTRK